MGPSVDSNRPITRSQSASQDRSGRSTQSRIPSEWMTPSTGMKDKTAKSDDKCPQGPDRVTISNTLGEFAFLSYNVEGITSKLKDTNFVSFIQKFDFVTLVETFVESFTSTQFPDFTSFVAPAKKLSKKGRRSGGIIILIKNKVLPYFKRVDVDNNSVIIFEADRVLFGTDVNVFLVSTYLPPINSPFYDITDFDNGVSMLDQCLLDILEKKDDAAFIMCGDFNARTSSNVAPFYDLTAV